MLKDITIGQYFPGDTIIHKIDPRIKIIIISLFIMSLFFVNSFVPYVFIVLFILGVVKLSNIPLKFILKGIKPLRYLILITFLINIFMTKGEVLIELFWKLTITKEGLYLATFMALRLVFLITGTSLLTLTTSPIALTDGIEKLLNHFKKIGLPAHELAMMITLLEETDKIMKAQMARGADFESGNVLSRAKNLVPLLVPLFINAFRRADELATAMEARCYRGGDNRTRLNELKLNQKDMISLIGSTAFFIGIISTRFL